MARDDFLEETKRILAERVNYKCSNPKCRQSTTGPGMNSNKSVRIGVASHITAASERGERYDSSLTSQERKSINNGIHLCQNCGKMIDSDSKTYTVEKLYQWKKNAEDEAVTQLKGSLIGQNRQIKLSMCYKRNSCLTDKSEEHHYTLTCTMTNHKAVPIKSGYIEVRMPTCVVTDGFVRPVIDTKDEKFCIFRKHIDSNILLYPDESQSVSIHYYMDNDLFKERSTLYGMPITFKYCDDTGNITEEEKNFGLCQEF